MDVFEARGVAGAVVRLQVNHLPSHHASDCPDGMGEFLNDLQGALRSPIARAGDGFKGQGQQSVAGENRAWPRRKPRAKWACRAAGRRCREPANRRESASRCELARARFPLEARSSHRRRTDVPLPDTKWGEDASPRKYGIAHCLVDAGRILLRGRKDALQFRVHQDAGLLKMLANCFR